MPVRLTSVDELKDFLRIPSAETGQDARLAGIVEEISAQCESFTGRTFTYTSYANEAYRGGGSVVILRNYPVDSAATFQAKSFDSWSTLSIFDPADYAVDYVMGIVRLLGGLKFSDGPNGAQMTYSGGFASSGTGTAQKIAVPGDLSRSVRHLCAANYRYQASVIDAAELAAATEMAEKVWAQYIRH